MLTDDSLWETIDFYEEACRGTNWREEPSVEDFLTILSNCAVSEFEGIPPVTYRARLEGYMMEFLMYVGLKEISYAYEHASNKVGDIVDGVTV